MRKLVCVLVISILTLTACRPPTPPAPVATTQPLALNQTFQTTLTNATLSVNYPDGWAVGGEFPDLGITVATSEALANNSDFNGVVSDGEVYVGITFVAEDLLEGGTPLTVLQGIVDGVENPEGTVSEIVEQPLNGKPAAIVTLDSEGSSDGITLVVDSGDTYSLVTAAVSDGQLPDFRATIEAIAGSIRYEATEPAAESTEASQ